MTANRLQPTLTAVRGAVPSLNSNLLSCLSKQLQQECILVSGTSCRAVLREADGWWPVAGAAAGGGRATLPPGSTLLTFRAAPVRAGLFVARSVQAHLGGLQVPRYAPPPSAGLVRQLGRSGPADCTTQCARRSVSCPGSATSDGDVPCGERSALSSLLVPWSTAASRVVRSCRSRWWRLMPERRRRRRRSSPLHPAPHSPTQVGQGDGGKQELLRRRLLLKLPGLAPVETQQSCRSLVEIIIIIIIIILLLSG